jgi:CRP-like cAMP-binding protein
MVPLRRIEALAENPDLARAWARHLAIEVQRARAQAEVLSPRTVAERVDAWITLHDGALPPRGNWQQLASEIGVTPEPLYRELARRC